MGAVFALMVFGLQVILRTSGVFNFAHGQFYTIGAYAFWATYFLLGLNFVLAIALTILVMLLLGGLTQLSIFRFVQQRFSADTPLSSKLLMSAMASVGLMMILARAILIVCGTETRGIPSVFPQIISIGDSYLAIERLVIILISCLIAGALYLFFYKTMLGKSMRAVSSDAAVSTLMGINSARIYLLSFGVGCALAGIAGALLAPVFSVSPEMGGEIIFMAMLVMVVGGITSYKGGVVASAVVGLAVSFGYQFLGVISNVFLFVAVMLFIIFRPGGLFGEIAD